MALFRCKMCGGTLEINPDSSIAVCEYCGTKQTVPKADDEKKLNLFNRANRLRFANEFDKAAGVYESIVTEFPEEAEAYWGLVLCKYGIEYVDDPRTLTKIPTCHRTAYDSIFKDANFELALEYADTMQSQLYRDEAKEIDRLQKAILEIAAKQEPFDVFISYKETGETGTRTEDSVIANDIYDALTAKGFKVFYSRITLESKLGQEYEPIIFSALNSAKVMLAIGTKYEYYNAVWVKNEWSRYLQMMKEDKAKTLIPCYKGIDAYDMPEEFTHLQAQDMGKIGAVQELVRGIERLIAVEEKVSVATGLKDIIAATLEKTRVAIEKGDYENANRSIEAVLGFESNNAAAYLYRTVIDLKLKSVEQLIDVKTPLENNKNFIIALENADTELKKQLDEYNTATLYNCAVKLAGKNTVSSLSSAITIFERILDYKDSLEKVEDVKVKIKQLKNKQGNIYKIIAICVAIAIGFTIAFSYISNKNQEKRAKEAQIRTITDRNIQTAQIGDIVEYGQLNMDSTNNLSPVEWIVLDKKDDNVLLVSKLILSSKKFGTASDRISWADSNIKNYLNSDFYNRVFSEYEKLNIKGTILEGDLEDNIFILSQDEMEQYLTEDTLYLGINRMAVGISEMNGYWTRTCQKNKCVAYNFENNSYETIYPTRAYGIRPAMWIDLSIVEK